MILGDHYRDEEITKTLASLRDNGVSRVYINFNGTEKAAFVVQQELKEFCPDLDIVVVWFKWEDDFSLARNQSFSLVDKDEFEWILWIDSDDILKTEHGLLDLVKNVNEHQQGIFLRYDYAIEPETRQVVVEQWRERVLRTGVDWEWVHPIHEVCLGPPGTQFLRLEEAWIEHQRASGEDRGARQRNRKIIDRALMEHPDVPRYVFYLGGETMAEADATEDLAEKARLAHIAIEAYEKFKNMIDEVNDDYFIAQSRIAECHRMAGEYVEAFEADLETIAIYPSWPDGFIGAAKSCMELGDFGRMLTFADIATKMPKPRTAASIESMNSGFTPIFLRGIANENLGNIEAAKEDYKLAQSYWHPPGTKIDEKIAELENTETITEAINKPDNDRMRLLGSKPDKSIAFVTTPIPEDWHPELMKVNGSGGAELCIMALAPMFAADGWRVVVFGTPGPYRGVYEADGVEYWAAGDFLITEKFNTMIASRTGQPYTVDLNVKKKIVWMHDVNIGSEFGNIAHIPDKIVALSPWHKEHLSKLYRINLDHINIIPNGIDISRFPKKNTESNKLGAKFIWSSSYDRGLDTLLALWPSIKNIIPEASLDIFYGWNMMNKSIEQWDKFNKGQAKALQDFKNKIEAQMQILGANGSSDITHHGRVDQNTLASYMNKATIWPYTTQFMETFCITAIEMQAAGVIPIASRLAALKNNIAVSELLIEGWPQNVTYQNQFLEKLEAVYSATGDEILQARQEGRKLAESMTWENAYQKWNDLFISMDK